MNPRRPESSVVKRCKRWLKESLLPDFYDKVDWDAEIDSKLTLNENINLLLERFPEAFSAESRDGYYRRVKRIVFISDLIEKVLRRDVRYTYRKTPLWGYYRVVHSRFIRSHLEEPACVIEVYDHEAVNTSELTDRDAQLAGVETVKELWSLFKRWYGEPLPREMWRNWFEVKEELPS